MAANECTRYNFKNDHRVSHTFSSQATACSSKCCRNESGCSRICCNDIRNKQNDRTRSSRTICSFTKLPIIDVSCSQRRRLGSTNIQLESTEFLHHNRSIQANKRKSRSRFSTTARLAMQNRPLASVFPFVCSSQPQKVSAPNLSKRIARNDLLTFWPKYSSQNFCYAHKLDSSDSQATRCQDR